ncbi:MAG: hypothetical protein ACRDLB_11410 [Actinomycetota bacterium]
MAIEAGVIVPHAPVLALEDRPELDFFRRSAVDACRTLDACDVLILLSPHGEAEGVYRAVEGSLKGFGLGAVAVSATTDDAMITRIASSWDREILEAEVDHGIVGALAIGRPSLPIIACSLAEVTGPAPASEAGDVVESAFLFADALQGVAGDEKVGLIASAHTAAALTPRAPLALRPEAKELDDMLLDHLATDCGGLARVEPDLWSEAEACGAGPLTVFGVLFEGRRADVLAYDHPFGVGYLVATASHG